MERSIQTPFALSYDDAEDKELIRTALSGSAAALEALVKRHQHYIYNVAHKLVLSPFDAEDLTQEVLIKVVTKLSQFNGDSNFRTWLYRITFNHFLQMKKYWLEDAITGFDNYALQLDSIRDQDLTVTEQLEMKELIEDAKLGCMSGMLLCLDRRQRLVYVLGEIFGVDHGLGAELLDISRENFRQLLSRARRDLYQFMNGKCGLINASNPCRCQRKTKGFIEAGWVDPKQLKFNTSYLRKTAEAAKVKSMELDHELDGKYAALFRDHPFQEKEHATRLLRTVLDNRTVIEIFDLN